MKVGGKWEVLSEERQGRFRKCKRAKSANDMHWTLHMKRLHVSQCGQNRKYGDVE